LTKEKPETLENPRGIRGVNQNGRKKKQGPLKKRGGTKIPSQSGRKLPT